MYLKGEGGEANTTRAIEVYENATSLNSIRALNGLGYIYFVGSVVTKNQTKAFHYFNTAALTRTDADSLFNAGYCLEGGYGVDKNLQTAALYYSIAAKVLSYLLPYRIYHTCGHLMDIYIYIYTYTELRSLRQHPRVREDDDGGRGRGRQVPLYGSGVFEPRQVHRSLGSLGEGRVEPISE